MALRLFATLGIWISLALSLQAQPKKKLAWNEIAISALKPATNAKLKPLYGKVIGVGEFHGPDGTLTPHARAYADVVVSALEGCGKYTVADRTKLDKVLEEIRLQLSGPMEDSSVVRAGLLVGAQVMALGTIRTDKFTEDRSTSTVTDAKTGKTRTNETITRRYQLSLSLQFVDVESGAIVDQMELNYRADNELIPPLAGAKGYERVYAGMNATEPSMFTACMDRAATSIQRAVGPYAVDEVVEFQSSKETRDSIALVVVKYQTHHKEEALQVLERALANTQKGVRAEAQMNYNLGCFFRAEGDYARAKTLFEKAYVLVPKEDQYRLWFEEMHKLTAN